MTFQSRKLPAVYKENCPNCSQEFRYYRFGGMGQICPHFYCSKCSNVLFREYDYDFIMKNNPSEKVLNEIVTTLPKCSCGGTFSPFANPKCPHCYYDLFPRLDAVSELTNPYAIVLKGSYFITEIKSQPSIAHRLFQKLITIFK